MEVIVPPSEKPKRQPKFKALDLEEMYNLRVNGNVVEYEVDGPSGHLSKRIAVSEPLHVFVVKEVLSEIPKAMTYLMKVALGRLSAEDIDEEHKDQNYIRDVFQEWDLNVIRNSKHAKELIEACKDFCRYNGVCSVLSRKFLTSLVAGDVIEVTTMGYGMNTTTYTVVSTDSGIKTLDAEGVFGYLMHWEFVTDVTPKQVKQRK
jgi:nitrogen regulatory protein PII